MRGRLSRNRDRVTDHPGFRLTICRDPGDLTRRVAEEVVRRARQVLSAGHDWSLALSGGNTPLQLYSLLASEGFRERVPWTRARVFLGDERFVPPDHPESNYGMAKRALLSRVDLPAGHLYPVPTEGLAAAAAAASYESTLRSCFPACQGRWPRFDVMLLGLGADGHTASLFPATQALAENRRLVVANRVKQLGVDRITMTFPVLNASARVLFLVSGESKARALRQVLEGTPDPDRFPAQRVRPRGGSLHYLVDRAAASLLETFNTAC